MGDRANIIIKDTGIAMYLHWGAKTVEKQIKTVLQKRERWDEPAYLARMIFNETTKDLKSDILGSGLYVVNSDNEVWDGHIIIIINCKEETVAVRDNEQGTLRLYTFEEFVKQ